jgi:hypothetical protein
MMSTTALAGLCQRHSERLQHMHDCGITGGDNWLQSWLPDLFVSDLRGWNRDQA